MQNNELTITKGQAGHYHVAVNTKPATEVIKSSLQILCDSEVRKIQISMPAALATEFRVVQSLAFLRREGKAISVIWTDHTPSASAQQIIQSIIQ